MQSLWRIRWRAAIGAILGVAVLARFLWLETVPLPLADEVFAAVDLHSLLTTGHHFDGGHAGILAYIIPFIDGRFISSFVLGGDLPDLRTVSAVFGLGTVALMVPLGIELGDLALGVVAAAALAVMPWDIYFSRVYFPASEYLFLTVLAVLLALRALRQGSMLAAAGAALAAVASVYLYPVGIIATPLLLVGVLILRRHQVHLFGFPRTLAVMSIAAFLLVPYLVDHLIATDPVVGNQGNVIAVKMIWNHGLSAWGMADQFLRQWLSLLSGPFIIVNGDPNVRQSIQVMGSVGWITGIIGWIGVVVAIMRRGDLHRLLLFWLAAYPVANALTYYDAWSNSVRGITGAFVWALLVAIGILAIRQVAVSWLRVGIAAAISVGVVAQTLAFAVIYFGPYNQKYAYAFETGYSKIYSTLRDNHLESIPITLHAGYRRDFMLQYFSQYQLHASDQVLACYDLPFRSLHPATLPRIFVVREDRDMQSTPGCIHHNLISRDKAALLSAATASGEAARKVDVIAIFPDDASSRYFTAIFNLHN